MLIIVIQDVCLHIDEMNVYQNSKHTAILTVHGDHNFAFARRSFIVHTFK